MAFSRSLAAAPGMRQQYNISRPGVLAAPGYPPCRFHWNHTCWWWADRCRRPCRGCWWHRGTAQGGNIKAEKLCWAGLTLVPFKAIGNCWPNRSTVLTTPIRQHAPCTCRPCRLNRPGSCRSCHKCRPGRTHSANEGAAKEGWQHRTKGTGTAALPFEPVQLFPCCTPYRLATIKDAPSLPWAACALALHKPPSHLPRQAQLRHGAPMSQSGCKAVETLSNLR